MVYIIEKDQLDTYNGYILLKNTKFVMLEMKIIVFHVYY